MYDEPSDFDDYEIADYEFTTSILGNAYFSGLTFEQLWQCVSLSETPEELDAAVAITIDLTEMIGEKHENSNSNSNCTGYSGTSAKH